ncbi:MAG: type IV pilus assembly protein PilM [Candidatus Pacebacteria bacterium]|nr:type IV pilus assembly protein PilM [Candidatus Paceibacterota bacterium]
MWNFFKKKSPSVIGIDIGSSAIKVVQIKRVGEKAVLETYGALALGPYAEKEVGQATNLDTDKIVEALNDIIREAKISTKTNGLAIPFRSSLMSIVEMPDVPNKELAQMIPIEARKYIPVPISEVSLDWSVIPTDKFSESKGGKKFPTKNVLVVAIHNEAFKKYQEIVTKAQLDTKFFEIEIFSTMRSVLSQQEKAPVMIFDMGAAFTKLYIVERGTVRASHTINKGSQDITSAIASSFGIPIADAERLKRGIGLSKTDDGKSVVEVVDLTLSYIFSEANRVLINYQKKYNKAVQRIVLVGGGSSLKGLKELSQQKFGTEVSIGNPFDKVEAPAFLENTLRGVAPDFSVAMGIAIRRLQELE